jgi:hypothetical protein
LTSESVGSILDRTINNEPCGRPRSGSCRWTFARGAKGSPKLSAALQRLDLVDEYRFVVHPVVAGQGPFLFSGLQPSLLLKFVAATRLKSGIVALHYRRR